MGRNRRRRPTGARRATSAAVALILGGGGLVAVNVYASATESGGGGGAQGAGSHVLSAGAATIDCPDVGDKLTTVPDAAKGDVDKELATLDQQIAEAYQQLRSDGAQMEQNGDNGAGAVMNPLKEKRSESIGRIVTAVDAAGDRPEGLDDLAACTLRSSGDQSGADENGDQSGGQDQGQEGQAGQDQGAQGQDGQQGGGDAPAGNGPVVADFADINSVQPAAQSPRAQNGASTGEFVTSCGVNANGLFNSDNVIVAPGVTNGAHHFHDYVGNQSNNAFASDDDLAKADTTCQDKGDKSTYYWPVLRLQNGTRERDADAAGGGTEGNSGEIVTPKQVTLTFVGNARGKVTAMPRLLRIITGDAKAFVNGTANANASWSCTGFEDRQLKDKYPVCPQGSDVVRTFRFQSCWDGANIDSANHRTHVAFQDAEGNCPGGFKAIPQLVQRIVYDVDAPSLKDGGRTSPLFAVDSFPEQLHKPVTDHGDFINVFDDGLMKDAVDCINQGRKCGVGAGDDNNQDPEETGKPQEPSKSAEPPNPSESAEPPNASEEPSEQPAPTADDPSDDNGGQAPGDDDGGQTAEPPAGTQGTEPAGDDNASPIDAEPKADVTSSGHAAGAGGSHDDSDDGSGDVGTAASTAPVAGSAPSAASQTEPQAVAGGGLADTGAQLWPAAIGGIFVIAGFVLLRRIRRGAL
ncbi:DUF1996 domain-containing protein [Streptomyces sp. NBC_01281]|uniref:DUF1996 domain-containing protein n=1 Tax=unclassified Streptomyces TaxID=2593676 RepID=UPI002E0E1386|nr:DUF1996 domain-containing protein [Streptomyces sp. NBC_01281]